MRDYSDLERRIGAAVDDYDRYKSQFLDTCSSAPTTASASSSFPASPVSGKFDRTTAPSAADRRPAPGRPRAAAAAAAAADSDDDQNDATSDTRGKPAAGHRLSSTRAALEARGDVPALSEALRFQQESASPFLPFCVTAEVYELRTLAVDLAFLTELARCVASGEAGGVPKLAKRRRSERRAMWREYTASMGAMAMKYKKKQLAVHGVPLSGWKAAAADAADRLQDLKRALAADGVDSKARSCLQTAADGLGAMQKRAASDIHTRYAMQNPIDDKETPVVAHNARTAQFTQVARFVADDLRTGSGSGGVHDVVAAGIESLIVGDYPPFKS